MAIPATNRLISSNVKGANFGPYIASVETQSTESSETVQKPKDTQVGGHGLIGHLVEITGSIDDPKEKANIIKNCEWICKNSKIGLDKANENIAAGRVAWQGLKELPEMQMSGRLYFLSGGTDREIYSNNVFLYQIANAINLSLKKGTKVGFYFDIDGCISNKSRRPYATREAQPVEQIHELYIVIKLLSKLGLKVTTNTNRAPLTTPILVTPKALKPFTNTDCPHNSPMVEIAGLDPETACKMSESLGIGALSSGFADMPGEDTFIHPELRLMYDLFNVLGEEFWDDFVKKAAIEFECTTVEPKGLNSLLMLEDSCLSPSYKGFLRISAIKAHHVKHKENKTPDEITKEYEAYKDELLNHIQDRDGDRNRKGIKLLLTEIKELLEKKEKHINNDESINTYADDTKSIRLVEELNSIKLKSQFSLKPDIR